MNIKNVIIVKDNDYIQAVAIKIAIDTENKIKKKYN